MAMTAKQKWWASYVGVPGAVLAMSAIVGALVSGLIVKPSVAKAVGPLETRVTRVEDENKAVRDNLNDMRCDLKQLICMHQIGCQPTNACQR